jgi:hypothetical protein
VNLLHRPGQIFFPALGEEWGDLVVFRVREYGALGIFNSERRSVLDFLFLSLGFPIIFLKLDKPINKFLTNKDKFSMTSLTPFFKRPLLTPVPNSYPCRSEFPRVGDFVEFQFFSLGKEFGFFRGLVLSKKRSQNFIIYDGFHGIFFNLSLTNPSLAWFTVLKPSHAYSGKNVSKFIS